MRVKAAMLREMGLPRPYAVSKPLTVVDIELDEPGAGEVLPHCTWRAEGSPDLMARDPHD